jgi:peroxiredoxin
MPLNEESRMRPRSADWFVLCLLAVSLLGNLTLAVAFLRVERASTAVNRTAAIPPSGPAIGTDLPPLVAREIGGRRRELTFSSDGRPTLLYIFTPQCTWCAKNLANLKHLVAAAKNGHRIVGLSLDPNVGSYVKDAAFEFPVFVEPSSEMFEPYRLGPTPTTLIISQEGRVLKSWVGAYAGATEKDIESYFSVTLPGLVRSAVTAQKGG